MIVTLEELKEALAEGLVDVASKKEDITFAEELCNDLAAEIAVRELDGFKARSEGRAKLLRMIEAL